MKGTGRSFVIFRACMTVGLGKTWSYLSSLWDVPRPSKVGLFWLVEGLILRSSCLFSKIELTSFRSVRSLWIKLPTKQSLHFLLHSICALIWVREDASFSNALRLTLPARQPWGDMPARLNDELWCHRIGTSHPHSWTNFWWCCFYRCRVPVNRWVLTSFSRHFVRLSLVWSVVSCTFVLSGSVDGRPFEFSMVIFFSAAFAISLFLVLLRKLPVADLIPIMSPDG